MNSNKPVLRIDFADFWGHFDKQDNYFSKLLSRDFSLEFSDDPDLLIYSCYGTAHLNYSCLKLFYNGENLRVNWNATDFAMGFDYVNDPRYFRMPNWVLYADCAALLAPRPDPETVLASKTGFCNMVVSNPHARERIDFFHKLSAFKKVDSGGRYLNNVGGPVPDKVAFIRQYKFTIAFENSSYPGYTTEKIFEPMLVNSVPIYWGNPEVGKDFNTKSFINAHDFPNEQALIDYILEVDRDDEKYKAILKESWYRNNELPACVREENIREHFHKAVQAIGQQKPVSQTWRNQWYRIQLQVQRIDNLLNRFFKYKKNFR